MNVEYLHWCCVQPQLTLLHDRGMPEVLFDPASHAMSSFSNTPYSKHRARFYLMAWRELETLLRRRPTVFELSFNNTVLCTTQHSPGSSHPSICTSIIIKQHRCMNKADGFSLSRLWNPLIHTMFPWWTRHVHPFGSTSPQYSHFLLTLTSLSPSLSPQPYLWFVTPFVSLDSIPPIWTHPQPAST